MSLKKLSPPWVHDLNLRQVIAIFHLLVSFRDGSPTSKLYGVFRRILATLQPWPPVFQCLGTVLRLGRTKRADMANSKCPHHDNDQSLNQQKKPQEMIPQPLFASVSNGEVVTSHGAPCPIEPSVEGCLCCIYIVWMILICHSRSYRLHGRQSLARGDRSHSVTAKSTVRATN